MNMLNQTKYNISVLKSDDIFYFRTWQDQCRSVGIREEELRKRECEFYERQKSFWTWVRNTYATAPVPRDVVDSGAQIDGPPASSSSNQVKTDPASDGVIDIN